MPQSAPNDPKGGPQPLPLGRGAYTRPVARMPEIILRNRFFEQNPSNMVDAAALLSRPGSSFLFGVGEGPIRKNYTQEGTFNGDLFTVSGDRFYRTTKLLVPTQIAGLVAGNPDGTPAIVGTDEFVFLADGASLQFYDGTGSRSKGTLSVVANGNAANTNTVTLQGVVYTFKTVLTPSAFEVLIGATPGESLQNLADAVNATAEFVNVTYGTGTVANQFMTADYVPLNPSAGNYSLGFTALVGGVAGNAYTTVEGVANWSFGAATLTGGVAGGMSGVPTPDDVGIVSLAVLDGFVLCLAALSARVYFIRPGKFLIDPQDFFEAETVPDEGISLRTVGDQVWIFGSSSTDAYYLSDDPAFPFARYSGRAFNKGVIEGTDVTMFGTDEVTLVGNDQMVYSITGGGAQRISNHGVEERIRKALKFYRDNP